MSNTTQEQYLISDKNWLNGFKLKDKGRQERFFSDQIPFAYSFYSQKRNEVFVVGWNS
jgi:hypothetical protein